MGNRTGLVKFMNETDGGDRGKLHWNRAEVDGAPFRGNAPRLTEAEYRNRVTKVGDPKNGIFDLTKPEENQQYLSVMDKIVNQWARLIHVERVITAEKKEVYIEWVEWFMEDGAAPQKAPPGVN